MKPQNLLYMKIAGVFAIVQIITFGAGFAVHLYTQTHKLTSFLAPFFVNPIQAILYIISIAVFGGVLAAVFRYREKIQAKMAAQAKKSKKKKQQQPILNLPTLKSLFYLIIPLLGIEVGLMLAQARYFIAVEYGLMLVLAILFLSLRKHNAIMTIIFCSVMGFIMGVSFSFVVAGIFYIGLAVYDIIAVFITKHMMTLARNIAGTGFGIFMATTIFGEKKSENKMKVKKDQVLLKGRDGKYQAVPVISDWAKKKVAAVLAKKQVPVAMQNGLGWGDLTIPPILTIAGLAINPYLGLAMLVGSIAGIFITLFILNTLRRPLPAIPFLGIGMLIAYVLYIVLI